jgi:hypothetical protein
MGVWQFTAKEKKAIGAAWDACRWLAAYRNQGDYLEGAVRYERKHRSCLAAARWLVVEGFAKGLCSNPRASAIAFSSQGVQIGTLVGAACRGERPSERFLGDVWDRFDGLVATAREAHHAYIDRGLGRATRLMSSAIGNEIELHKARKAVEG